jgi:predicted 3-demethylubiquinone-9 3-methyltransferase (glyoxalase superfamily)
VRGANAQVGGIFAAILFQHHFFIKIFVMAKMQKITSCLWFNNQAEEAANFYTSVFKNSRIGKVSHFGEEGFEMHKRPAGSVMTVQFYLEDQEFTALNGGPAFKFNEALSLVVNCETQQEIDYYWEKLSEGGDKNAQQCGWLKDRFGLSWQVTPTFLSAAFSSGISDRTEHLMKAMLQMKKLDLAKLKKAYNEPAMSET